MKYSNKMSDILEVVRYKIHLTVASVHKKPTLFLRQDSYQKIFMLISEDSFSERIVALSDNGIIIALNNRQSYVLRMGAFESQRVYLIIDKRPGSCCYSQGLERAIAVFVAIRSEGGEFIQPGRGALVRGCNKEPQDTIKYLIF